MKTSIYHLMNDELTAKDFGFPILTTCKVSRTYVNKELIYCFRRILACSKKTDERVKILLRLKKVVLQTLREPDKSQFESETIEFVEFFKRIKKEQAFYNPISWINAELDFIKNSETNANVDTNDMREKDFLDFEEMKKMFGISTSGLNRRVSDGMPVVKLGSKKLFPIKQVKVWLDSLN